MDTSNNPFASDSVPFQKGGLLLDLGGGGDVYKQNGTSPSANDLYFLDRPANGRSNFDDDDDFGPETDVDAVDDVLLSPAKILNSSRNNNAFEDEEADKRTLEADLELQRQQLSDFDPVREPREETPTPPADEVPGVTNVVPESDNVAESGEDSEDEWNYFRVEPTAGAAADSNQQTTQPVCEPPAKPQAEEEEDDENMESQLNPNAAEFVPSPTQLMPSMEEILLAESPKKGVPMEDISVPTHKEFQNEVSQRPSDLADEKETVTQQKIAAKLPDLISTEECGDTLNPFLPPGAICGKSVHHIENGGSFADFLEQGDRNFQELCKNNIQSSGGLALDESEVSSTKAEFGDDSTLSFMTSELQKTITESVSSFSTMEKSFVEQDMLGNEFSSDMTNSEENESSDLNESEQFFKEQITKEVVANKENIVPMSFEIQKELVPEMECKPERVQLESEGTSSFEQDSGSPVQPEDAKSGELNVNSPLSTPFDLQAPAVEERPTAPKVEDILLTTHVTSNPFPVQDDLFLNKTDDFTPMSPKPVQSPSQSPVLSNKSLQSPPPSPGLPQQLQSAPKSPLLSQQQPSPPPSPGLPQSLQSPPPSPGLPQSLQSPPPSPGLPKPLQSPPPSPGLSKPLQSPPPSPGLPESLQSPPPSPGLSKSLQSPPILSLNASKSLESPPQSPTVFSKLVQSPPKSPLWEGSSPIPGAADTTSSTPETVPLGKDCHSPSFETKSPMEDFSPLMDTQPLITEEKQMKLEESSALVESEQPSQENVTDFDNMDMRPPLNKFECALPADSSTENQNILGIVDETLLIKPAEEITVTQTPPPTPAIVSEETLAPQLTKEMDILAEKVDLVTEKIDVISEKTDLPEKVDEKGVSGGEAVAAAAVAVAVATTLAARAAVTSENKAVEGKKPPAVDAKKAAKDKKTPVTDKTKPKPPSGTKLTTTAASKVNQKTAPTSPTKPLTTTTARTSTPKKPTSVPAATPSTPGTRGTKTPSTSASKPKAAVTPTTKATAPSPRTTASTPKPAAASPRPKPTNAATASKSAVLINGEATKPAAIKKPSTLTATTKPPARPSTAPAGTRTTVTKTTSVASRTSTVTSAPRPKPASVNGTTNKPRATGPVAPSATRNKVGVTRDAKQVTDKQVKETANKQISSARTVTATKSATTAATKRVSGVTKTSVSATSTVKSAASKTTTKKTTVASSKTTTKTAVTVATTENNELVQVQAVTASTD